MSDRRAFRRLGLVSLLVTGLALAVASGVAAVTLDDSVEAPAPQLLLQSAVRAGDPVRQAALERAPAWQTFRARHGAWSATWNEASGTPHRAAGPAIALAGFADDSTAVDRAVRDFVAAHPEQFLAPKLETVAIQRIGHVWYARYRQLLGGVPVLLSDWEFRVSTSGRLFMFGADAWRGSPSALRSPRLARSVARASAVQALGLDLSSATIDGGERPYLLPIVDGEGARFRLVYDLRARSSTPIGYWAVMVDAVTGEVVQRQDLMRHAITGQVTGTIHPAAPLNPLVPRELPLLLVAVGADTVPTDATGAYSLPANSGTIAAELRGLFCDVDRGDGPDASVTIPAPGPGNYDVVFNDANSHSAERDAYSFITTAHTYIKSIDPGFTGLDRPVHCTVNFGPSCNGQWDGYNIQMYSASTGLLACENFASSITVVHHEYGHGIGYELWRQASGDPLAYPMNEVISEGTAELYGVFITDEPVQGRDLYGLPSHIRTTGNEARWPEDRSGTGYNTMFILTGSFWDLRRDVGLELPRRLLHFALYGMPDDPDDGIAMSEYFLETLVADDDDADLANGTPHLDAILRAFNPRGIGTSFFFTFGHTAIGDQAGSGVPIPVTATIRYAGPIGALDPASPTLVYSLDSAPEVALPMTPTGNPDEYTAAIPPAGGALVRYYIRARDSYGGAATWPIGAPGRRPFAFVRGTPAVLFADDMEVDRGWVVGAPGDSATSGLWVRVDPTPTIFFDQCAPGDDHTPGAGVLAWVTGNSASGQVNNADVDGGRTTLTSPMINASGAANPILEYYRWYMNRVIREPDAEYWRVFLSNDGGANWVAVENTTHTEGSWQRFLVRVSDYLPPTATMKVRFVARDSMSNSTVEGGVDDVRMLGFVPTAVVLQQFVATPLAASIELRWQFSASGGTMTAIERGARADGPWDPLAIEIRPEGDAFVARDEAVAPGETWYYRLVVTEPDGNENTFGPVSATLGTPSHALAIEPVAPSPTSADARIRFALPRAGQVRLGVYDVGGREVARLVDGALPAGQHDAAWDGRIRGARASAGVYHIRLDFEGARRVRRLIVVR